METNQIERAARALLSVRGQARGLEAFPSGCEPENKPDAYAVQDALVAALAQQACGWKVGCTSRLAQEMSNTDEPFFGRMFAATTHESPVAISMRDVMAPIVEPEIAFRLARDVVPDEPHQTVASIADAVDAIYPVIEVVDCRYAKGWPIAIEPTIADNGVHAVFAIGSGGIEGDAWRAVDRSALAMQAVVNGETVTVGVGANALDDPLNGLVWLANDFRKRGRTLYAGEIITTGNTANAPIFAKAGDDVEVVFDGLGEIRMRFE